MRGPWRTRYVAPAYPPIPDGTTGGGVWIGEILIDNRGRVSQVWTIREVKLTPALPSLNKAITAAVKKWEFASAAVDGVSVPICLTVAVSANLKAIRSGEGTKSVSGGRAGLVDRRDAEHADALRSRKAVARR